MKTKMLKIYKESHAMLKEIAEQNRWSLVVAFDEIVKYYYENKIKGNNNG